jgi:hypothetical protein
VYLYIYTCIGIFPGDDEEVVEDGMVKVFEENRYKLGVINRRNKERSQTVDVGSSYALDEDIKLLDILRKVRLGDLASRMGSGDERLGPHMFRYNVYTMYICIYINIFM